METFIKPTLNSLREALGYEDWEEVDEDALLFQQGYDGDIMEVEDGDTFTIPKNTLGQVVSDDQSYYMKVEVMDGVFDKEEIRGELMSGSYRLKGDLIIPEGYDD